jgi:hypothetical protein
MRNLANLVAGVLVAASLCIASVSPSRAATTTFVSGGGSDANACTLVAPCRTVGHAITAAGNGGTVSCLDAGPYTENFSSGSSYTVDCRGVVYANSAIAFTVSGTPQQVTFRNVIFDGAAGGGGAVTINGGAKVVFAHCTFQNFIAGTAVQFAPSTFGYMTITDSVFANNGTASDGGAIIIQPSNDGAGFVIERTQVTGNTQGIVGSRASLLSSKVLGEIRYSTIANNAMHGITGENAPVEPVDVTSIVVEHSASLQNGGNGIYANGFGAYVSLNDSTVAWNATGLATNGGTGTILSTGTNLIAGNPSPGVTPQTFGRQ